MTPHAAPDTNVELVEQFFADVLNGGNPGRAVELLTADFIAHHPALPGGQGSAADMAQLLGGFRRAFPDLRYTVLDRVADENRVVFRWLATGTHRGSFWGVEATEAGVRVEGMDAFRVANGRLAEAWAQSDMLGLLIQIGAVTPPAPE
jgi:steroid delta-isomerase-like uncharacterized protein